VVTKLDFETKKTISRGNHFPFVLCTYLLSYNLKWIYILHMFTHRDDELILIEFRYAFHRIRLRRMTRPRDRFFSGWKIIFYFNRIKYLFIFKSRYAVNGWVLLVHRRSSHTGRDDVTHYFPRFLVANVYYYYYYYRTTSQYYIIIYFIHYGRAPRLVTRKGLQCNRFNGPQRRAT